MVVLVNGVPALDSSLNREGAVLLAVLVHFSVGVVAVVDCTTILIKVSPVAGRPATLASAVAVAPGAVDTLLLRESLGGDKITAICSGVLDGLLSLQDSGCVEGPTGAA